MPKIDAVAGSEGASSGATKRRGGQPPQWPLGALLSARQAADRAGVSARTLKRWIADGLLPAFRLPSPKGRGHLRIRLADLEALLARGTLK